MCRILVKLVLLSCLFAPLSVGTPPNDEQQFTAVPSQEPSPTATNIQLEKSYSYAAKSDLGTSYGNKQIRANQRYCKLATTAARQITIAFDSQRIKGTWTCTEKDGEITFNGQFSHAQRTSPRQPISLHPGFDDLTLEEKNFLTEFASDLIFLIVEGHPSFDIISTSMQTNGWCDTLFDCKDAAYLYELKLGQPGTCSIL